MQAWKLLESNLKEFIIGESSVEVEELESLIQSMGARESEPRGRRSLGTLPPHYQSIFLSNRPYQSH